MGTMVIVYTILLLAGCATHTSARPPECPFIADWEE